MLGIKNDHPLYIDFNTIALDPKCEQSLSVVSEKIALLVAEMNKEAKALCEKFRCASKILGRCWTEVRWSSCIVSSLLLCAGSFAGVIYSLDAIKEASEGRGSFSFGILVCLVIIVGVMICGIPFCACMYLDKFEHNMQRASRLNQEASEIEGFLRNRNARELAANYLTHANRCQSNNKRIPNVYRYIYNEYLASNEQAIVEIHGR